MCLSITGGPAILAGHCNFCTALGMGEAHVILEDGTIRRSLHRWNAYGDGWQLQSSLRPREWKEDIDAERAGKAKDVPGEACTGRTFRPGVQDRRGKTAKSTGKS